MKIVIDFSSTYNNDPAMGVFTIELWEDIAAMQPADSFIFINMGKPVTGIPLQNLQRQTLRKTNIDWINQLIVKKALAGLKADIVVAIESYGYILQGIKSKKNTGKQNGCCQRIAFVAQENNTLQPPASVKIVQPVGRNAIPKLSWTEAENIKIQYTGGRSFFLFTGNISEQHQLLELLKAFSAFKKWQQSNMQLVIAGYSTKFTPVLEERLLTYKYRADVVVLKDVPGTVIERLAMACYAMVYPGAAAVFPFALVTAIQCNKAIIATAIPMHRQVNTTAEWVDAGNTAEGFAKAMIRLYKDERHQQLLIAQTARLSLQLNRNQLLSEVWACLRH